MLHRWMDRLSRVFARLWARPGSALSYSRLQVAVHPCVINNKPHIVYPRGLRNEAPQLFEQLRHHYQRQGYTLKEDQRSGNPNQSHPHERRRWAPVLLFSASMLIEGPLLADTSKAHEDPAHHTHATYNIVPAHAAASRETDAHDHHGTLATSGAPNAELAAWIFNLLSRHYQRNESDPEYVLSDFREMARYYSQFPDVVPILAALENRKWQLVFDEKTWATVASGNAFRVDSAEVRFNTRSAARLKLNNRCDANPVCIASPADALLHELLHAHSMLVNTEEFIAQGGMTRVLYAYKHEYAIIEKERKLYSSMSHVDGIKRPLRTDHTGRLVKAQCVVCIQ